MQFDNFEEVFAKDAETGATKLQQLRRRKTFMQQFTFYGANALLMPIVGLCYFIVGAEGFRQTMRIFQMRLYKLPVPGFGLLRDYDGWDRLDLAMLMALMLFIAVTLLWKRVFLELQGAGKLLQERKSNPLLFYMMASIAGILLLGDAALFCLGLSHQTSGGWNAAPWYVPYLASVLYMAGLALIGAWHADYTNSGKV